MRTIPLTLVLELILLLAALSVGGWPWAAIGLLGALLMARSAVQYSTLAIAGLWIVAFWIAEDRRLFFPFTMLWAVSAAVCMPSRRTWAGAAIVAAFLAIRAWQNATREVLLFELIVAALILGLAVETGKTVPNRSWLIAAIGSLLAFASLVL